jgi:hypothetical protein
MLIKSLMAPFPQRVGDSTDPSADEVVLSLGALAVPTDSLYEKVRYVGMGSTLIFSRQYSGFQPTREKSLMQDP